MRLILICTTAFLIFAGPVFSELTVQDLEKIRSIVTESENGLKKDIENIRSTVKESENGLKKDIENIRSTVKESENGLREEIKKSEEGLKEHIDFKVSEMDKRLNIVFGFVIALISLIVVVVGIPQIIMVWRGRGERTQAAEIQELRREIEMLKQQRT